MRIDVVLCTIKTIKVAYKPNKKYKTKTKRLNERILYSLYVGGGKMPLYLGLNLSRSVTIHFTAASVTTLVCDKSCTHLRTEAVFPSTDINMSI